MAELKRNWSGAIFFLSFIAFWKINSSLNIIYVLLWDIFLYSLASWEPITVNFFFLRPPDLTMNFLGNCLKTQEMQGWYRIREFWSWKGPLRTKFHSCSVTLFHSLYLINHLVQLRCRDWGLCGKQGYWVLALIFWHKSLNIWLTLSEPLVDLEQNI